MVTVVVLVGAGHGDVGDGVQVVDGVGDLGFHCSSLLSCFGWEPVRDCLVFSALPLSRFRLTVGSLVPCDYNISLIK